MLVFDHVGVTTTEPQPDENWVEQSRVLGHQSAQASRAHRVSALCAGHDGSRGGAQQSPCRLSRGGAGASHRGSGNPDPAFRGRRFPRSRVRAQIRDGVRIHALSQRRLVWSLTPGATGDESIMGYKAIYAYPWDLAESGMAEAAAPVPGGRSRHRHRRRQLSRGQVPAAARQVRQGLFPRGRRRLFQG